MLNVLDQVMGHPYLRKAMAAGEERMGRLVQQLLSSEKLAHGAQAAVSGALSAKAVLDRGVKAAMQAVNLPSQDDVNELRQKLSDLETLIDRLSDRVEKR
jgi:formiminotetrahydrofolate cyclodeaminase